MRILKHTQQAPVAEYDQNEKDQSQAAVIRDTARPVPARTRVLIVDPCEVMRRGVCALLESQEDFVVVGQAGSSRDAIVQAMQTPSDIVLLNVLPGRFDGLDIAQQMLRAYPQTSVVIFTGAGNEDHLFRALHIGVHGYLQQTLSLERFLTALRTIARGERVLSDDHAMTQVLDEFGRVKRDHDRLRRGLSDLDIELIRLAAEGLSNREIAARHFWSEVTVKRRMQDIYRKLQVTDRAQAVAEAMRMGFI